MTAEELVIAKQARVIANLRRSYTQLQTSFRRIYQEEMALHMWILLYATCYDEEARVELDDTLKLEHLAIWRDLQRWRTKEAAHSQ